MLYLGRNRMQSLVYECKSCKMGLNGVIGNLVDEWFLEILEIAYKMS